MANVSAGDLTFSDARIAADVRHAESVFSVYLSGLEEAYLARCKVRASRGWPVLAFLGHGRAGKDSAAEMFAKVTGLLYNGSLSQTICPLLSLGLGIDVKKAFAERHMYRNYWRQWCDEFRRCDPTRLMRIHLATSDIVVGIRARLELFEGIAKDVIQIPTWVHNVRTGVDPTLSYDAGAIVALPRFEWLDNNKDLVDLQEAVQHLAMKLGLA